METTMLNETHPSFEATCAAEDSMHAAQKALAQTLGHLEDSRVHDLPEDERDVQEIAIRKVREALSALAIATDALLSVC